MYRDSSFTIQDFLLNPSFYALPPSRCQGHRLRNYILEGDSGGLGQFQAVTANDDATLLKRLDQNHDAFRIAQLRIENSRPAGEGSGSNSHGVAGAKDALAHFNTPVLSNAFSNIGNDGIIYWPWLSAPADHT
jgi:hypothetical protein